MVLGRHLRQLARVAMHQARGEVQTQTNQVSSLLNRMVQPWSFGPQLQLAGMGTRPVKAETKSFDVGFDGIFLMNRNKRVPKPANHGARPCSSVGRKARDPWNSKKPFFKSWPKGERHRRDQNLLRMGKTKWKAHKIKTPQRVCNEKIYIGQRLNELAVRPTEAGETPRSTSRLYRARQTKNIPEFRKTMTDRSKVFGKRAMGQKTA